MSARLTIVREDPRLTVESPQPLVGTVATAPPGPPGPAGPNTVTDDTVVDLTLADPDASAVVALTLAGDRPRRIPLGATGRAVLAAVAEATVRDLLGLGTAAVADADDFDAAGSAATVGAALSALSDALGALAYEDAAPAGTLTGTTLAAGVTGSSLTSTGTLDGLTVTGGVVVEMAASQTAPAVVVEDAGGKSVASVAPRSMTDYGGNTINTAELRFTAFLDRPDLDAFIRANARGLEIGGGAFNDLILAGSGQVRVNNGVTLSTSNDALTLRTGGLGPGLYRSSYLDQAAITLTDQTGGGGTNGWRVAAMAAGGTPSDCAYFEPTYVRFVQPIRPPQMTDAAAPNDTLYFSTTAGKLVYKDAGGTVHPLY